MCSYEAINDDEIANDFPRFPQNGKMSKLKQQSHKKLNYNFELFSFFNLLVDRARIFIFIINHKYICFLFKLFSRLTYKNAFIFLSKL